MMRPKYPTTLAAARKAIRAHREREQTLINLRHTHAITITGLRAQLNDKEDKLLPAKTEIPEAAGIPDQRHLAGGQDHDVEFEAA